MEWVPKKSCNGCTGIKACLSFSPWNLWGMAAIQVTGDFKIKSKKPNAGLNSGRYIKAWIQYVRAMQWFELWAKLPEYPGFFSRPETEHVRGTLIKKDHRP